MMMMMMLLRCRVAAFSSQQHRHVLSRFTPPPKVAVLPSFVFSSSSSVNDDDPSNSSHYSPLYGKTLVSIQDCIDAQQQSQSSSQTKNTNDKDHPKVIFIDASWYHRPDPMTNQFRIPSSEYVQGPRLPLARYIDIDSVATTHELFPLDNPNKLPHMFPSPLLFGIVMDAYNIRNEDHIVIYARRGALFTPRMWFLFVSMGHDENRVHLMQGSLEDYVEDAFGESGVVEEYSLTDGSSTDGGAKRRETYYEEEYTEYFDDGILNVTRLYYAYAASTPRYRMSVSQASRKYWMQSIPT